MKPRSVGSGVLAAVIALGAVHLAAPAPAAAANGTTEVATTTYTLNPTAGRLDVEVAVTLTNSTAGYYLYAVDLALEQEAAALKVSSDRGSASIALLKRGDVFSDYRISFSNVPTGETRHLKVTYQVPGGAPRSASPTRAGVASASFCVIANGYDSGRTRVIVPAAFTMEVDAHNGTFTQSTADGVTTYQTEDLAKPFAFWACLAGDNPAGYRQSFAAASSGRSIYLEAWPEDPTWSTQVASQVQGALARLSLLIGRGLPGTGPITVREVSTGELGAYAGTFDPAKGVALVSDDLEVGTVAHELSHAWFNDALFAGRWLSEGSAGWAEATVDGVPCEDPGQYPGNGSPTIADWTFAGPRATDQELAIVDYEYAASCYLISSVANRIDPARMGDVFGALLDHTFAYRSGGRILQGSAVAADWRQWLDAVDELGLYPSGVTDLDYAQSLVARFGAARDLALLPSRSKARALYHHLSASIGSWVVPEAVLRPLTEWSFSNATAAMQTEANAFAAVTAAKAALPEVDSPGGPVKDLVEAARTQSDLAKAAQEAMDQQSAAEAIGAADAKLAAPVDPLGQVGLLGTDLKVSLKAGIAAVAAIDLAKATAQADRINSALAGATQQGAIRVGIVLGLLLLLVFVVWFRRRRRRAARLAAAAAAIGENTATGSVEAGDQPVVAAEAGDEPIGPLQGPEPPGMDEGSA